MKRAPLLLLCLGVLGCGDSDSGAPAASEPAATKPLLDHTAWSALSAEDDPLATHRPPSVSCPESSYAIEEGALELQTGYCNYAALAQPLTSSVAAGQPLHLVLWHADLVFDEPEEAHVAILVDGKIWWQATIGIPAQEAITDLTLEAPEDAKAGSTLVFHLHNHGFNTWTLLSLDAVGD